jgi:hypothetical protein
MNKTLFNTIHDHVELQPNGQPLPHRCEQEYKLLLNTVATAMDRAGALGLEVMTTALILMEKEDMTIEKALGIALQDWVK